MKIHRLLIDGFGLFDGRFELKLPEGIALILGDNETGKSTLLAAVGAILFGFGTETERASFAPYNVAGPRSGSLEIETDNERYRFTREFASNRARIELLGETDRTLFDGSAKPGGRTEEKDAYDELMRKLLGLESRELFYNSVFVEQDSLRAEMESVVRRIVSGTTSADYTVALENLKDTCEELTVAVPWGRSAARKARRIEILESELQRKRQALAETREGGAVIEQSRNRLASAESELAEVEKNIANHRAWEKDMTSFSMELEEKKRLEEQLNECRGEKGQIERLMEELRKCTEQIQKEYSEYASLPERAEVDMADLARLKQNENELEERFRQTETVDIFQIIRTRFSAATIIAGLLVVGLGAALLDGALRVAAILVGVGISAWPLISAVLSLRAHESARQGKLSEIKDQLDRLRTQSGQIGMRYAALDRTDPDDVLEKLRGFKPLRREKEIKEEALKQHPGLEEVESKYNSLSNELLLSDKKLDGLKSRRPSLLDVERSGRVGQAVEDIGVEILRLERKHDQLTNERDDLKYKLAAAEAKETVSEELWEEEIAEAESELNQLKLSREAHLLAIKALEEAISEFHSSHLARIEKKTSDYLGRITGMQCRVRLDEQLEPLGIERAGHHFKPGQLSRGARDQLHFALRLAAIEEVCGDIRLPILLDDPFVNFDESRLAATLQMLEALSGSHQIVLFASDRRYSDWHQPIRFLER